MELLPKQSVMEFHIDKRIENGHMEVTRETMTIIGAQEGKPELVVPKKWEEEVRLYEENCRCYGFNHTAGRFVRTVRRYSERGE